MKSLFLIVLLAGARLATVAAAGEEDVVAIDFAEEDEEDEFPLFDDPADDEFGTAAAAAAEAASPPPVQAQAQQRSAPVKKAPAKKGAPPPAAEHDLFDDEFGAGAADASAAAKTTTPRAKAAPSKVVLMSLSAKDWKMEMGFVALLVVSLFACIRGRSVNDQIAAKWLTRYVGESASSEAGKKALLRKEFAFVGCVGTIQSNNDIGVSEEKFKASNSEYALWATGRRNCFGLLVQLKLRRRQDLISMIVLETADICSSRDEVHLDFILNEGEMEPFVFALYRAKRAKKMMVKTAFKDVKEYATMRKKYGKKKKLEAAYESGELEKHIMVPSVVKTIDENMDLFISMHFTDGRIESPSEPSEPVQLESPAHLMFKFALPRDPLAEKDAERLAKLVTMACWFVDHMKRLKLSKNVKAKAVKRRAAKGQRERQAERAKKVADARAEERAEREKKYELMTPEQKRKLEAKETKAQQKRAMKRRTKRA